MSTTFPFYRAKHSQIKLFTHNHHPQYHKQFIVIIITIQHTYYYNHSSPSHWHFSFALSFHFIQSPFSVALFRRLAVFFLQSVICSHNTYFRPYKFSFWYSTSQRNLPHYTITDTLHPKKLVIHSINHSYIDILLYFLAYTSGQSSIRPIASLCRPPPCY